MKGQVLVEPLVDVVEPRALVTNAHCFKTLDLYTVTKADLAFTAPFELVARQNDYCHAFISWFDCDFSKCHKPLSFSTGESRRPSHWTLSSLSYLPTSRIVPSACVN